MNLHKKSFLWNVSDVISTVHDSVMLFEPFLVFPCCLILKGDVAQCIILGSYPTLELYLIDLLSKAINCAHLPHSRIAFDLLICGLWSF